jgi:hypothetical protein
MGKKIFIAASMVKRGLRRSIFAWLENIWKARAIQVFFAPLPPGMAARIPPLSRRRFKGAHFSRLFRRSLLFRKSMLTLLSIAKYRPLWYIVPIIA